VLAVRCWLRYGSKTAKMQKFPIDSHSNENFICSFFRPPGATNPQSGEVMSRPRLRPHANFGVNRPAGCREIVDRTKKQTNKKHTVKQIGLPRPSLYERMAGNNNNNNSTTMFMVLSSWQSHCESSPGSFDECGTAPSGRRPKTKPDDLCCEFACTGCRVQKPG